MSQVFTLFVARESGLHRLHPLTKLALVGFSLFCGVAVPGAWTSYAAFLLLLLPLSLWGEIAPAFLGAVWRVILPFAFSLFLVQGLFWTGGTPLIGIGPLSFKLEGVTFAAVSTGRILLIAGSFLLLSMTTRPDALMIALTQRGIPGRLAYLVVATIQIVPQFQAKANAIFNAQRARGLETEGRLLTRLRALVPLIGPLILGSLIDVEERAIAMEARGFSIPGPKTSLMEIPDSKIQGSLRWGLAGLVLLILVARLIEWLR